MRVTLGDLNAIPTDHCIAVGDGAAVALRLPGNPAGDAHDTVVAFPNRCLHQDSPLAGGRVFGGALTCPMHFWRYRLPEGTHTGGRGRLPSYPVQIDEDGTVHVEVPDPAPAMSMRERLLAHAREWERGE